MRPTTLPAALLLGLGLAAAPALAQTVREKVDVRVVTVRLTARDRSGHPVTDLQPGDLALSIDGKPAPIDTLVLTSGEALPTAAAPAAAAAEPPTLRPVAPPPPRQPERIRQTAIFIDEGETKSFDRRDVFDELTKFFRQPDAADQLFLVGRFDGSRLHVECPWAPGSACPLAAIAQMRAHPTAERLPTVSELTGSNTSQEEIDADRTRVCAALLETLALFPAGDARRQLVFVSGGTVFAHAADISEAVNQKPDPSSLPWGSVRSLFEDRRQLDRDRSAFVLWSRSVNPGRTGLTSGDVVAKAMERDIALVPIAADPADRDRNTMPAAFAENGTRDSGVSGLPTGTTPSGTLKPTYRLGVVQAMSAIAADTGGEPILSPRKTAALLTEIGGRAAYELTFRDPSDSDQHLHQIAITCRRTGVSIEYRRGYRIEADEDRVLDTVIARLFEVGHPADPAVSASLSESHTGGRNLTRVTVHFLPPRESNPASERALLFVAVGEKADGRRTEPVRWSATARQDADAGSFEAVTDLAVPYGAYRWSIAITDSATGLTAFAEASPAP